jgi:hypothetical protein
MKERMPALILAFAVVVALILNSRGKLIGTANDSVTGILFSPDGTNLPTIDRAGTFAMAFFAYLIGISFVGEAEATLLTVVIVLGALVYNEQTKGADSVLSVLFSPIKTGASQPASGSLSLPPLNPFGSGSTITPAPGGN